jgi:hypothetical protein
MLTLTKSTTPLFLGSLRSFAKPTGTRELHCRHQLLANRDKRPEHHRGFYRALSADPAARSASHANGKKDCAGLGLSGRLSVSIDVFASLYNLSDEAVVVLASPA